jgi:hypothetical protein
MNNKKTPFKLPTCGILVGNAIYNASGFLPGFAGWTYTTWKAQRGDPCDLVRRTVAENQGNLVQFWWFHASRRPRPQAAWLALEDLGIEIPPPDWENMKNLSVDEFPEFARYASERAGAGVLKSLRLCEELGLHSTMIYLSGVNPAFSSRFTENPHYIGYDFGERFTFRFDSENAKVAEPRLDLLARDFTARVAKHIRECKEAGYGNICCTSSNFYIDYEVAAGVDFTMFEDCTSDLNLASAISRGLSRQYGLGIWGSHIANEYYSWLDVSNPHRFETLRTEMAMKYMAGAKVIISESGAWHCQTPGDGAPQSRMPRIPGKPLEAPLPPDAELRDIAVEAEKLRSTIDENCAWSRSYRKVMSDFYDFVKENGTPAGQPETTLAIAKGNLDLCGLSLDAQPDPNGVVAGLHSWAESHMEWFEGAPEYGWGTAIDTFWPKGGGIYGDGQHNRMLSGTPYGQVDIVSFAFDQPDAEFLLANYGALAFVGWNTCSERQYKVLCDYVAGGGRLFISIPQLATDVSRRYASLTTGDLVRGGDFTELCGIRVKGRGPRFYWASMPNGATNHLGIAPNRSYGVFRGVIGDIEMSRPGAETVLHDHESNVPLLLRIPNGRGEVWFLNSWFYPGTFRPDYGRGSVDGDIGFVGDVLRHLAVSVRGRAYITEQGSDLPGPECCYVNMSFFPEDGRACLLNVDFEKRHTVDFHFDGRVKTVKLGPQQLLVAPACELVG